MSSNTEGIIKDLIEKLYRESSTRFNFYINPYSDNGYIEANDGTFLGRISNQYNYDSIFNKYGNYGSKYSNKSIFNKYGNYGSKYSQQSATNPYTNTPPKVFLNGRFVGYLTMNKYLNNALPTDLFIFYLMMKFNLLNDHLDNFIDLIS